MAMTAQGDAPARVPLSRQQVLAAALGYVDQYGLHSLSMHKLGAALGVKAMSLYKHVADKDDILDGIVDLMWEEIPDDPAAGDWREAIRQLATALRDLVHRHPSAAPLLMSRQELRERPLRIAHGILELMRESNVPEQCAVPMLRTVFPYGIGFALAELSLPPPPPPGPDREIALIRQVSGKLSPGAPDELVRTALMVCGDFDMTSQFRIGIDLMIHGLDAYLGSVPA
ncbi:MAG: TetR/AcrR family transcriptional regulator C-terminal domain-containing protein [Nocardiopsaceae bacterium]|nr:TetR/AcrR family transcriptional regulator C-terminal domain-containing protein [Nocardiopsaceae bacterium]